MISNQFENDDKGTGFNGSYRGVVVDNVDPLMAGRVRVRVYPMFHGVADETLPWAVIQQDASGGFMGVGDTGIPQIGANVRIVFENGDHRYPVLVGALPAMRAGIPHLHYRSRESGGVGTAIDSGKKGSVGIAGGGTWGEPGDNHASQYPNNRVISTRNGIVIELDDTAGAVRFHIFHPSGTRYEILNDGSVVSHSVGDSYQVTLGSDHVKIDGSQHNNIGGSLTVQVAGDVDLVASNVRVNADTITVNGIVTIN